MTRQISDLATPILDMTEPELDDLIDRLRKTRVIELERETKAVRNKNNAVRQKRQARKAKDKVETLFDNLSEHERELLLKQLEG